MSLNLGSGLTLEERERLRRHLEGLTEEELWDLLIWYFYAQGVQPSLLHAAGEHGMDLAVLVDPENDLLGRGYIVVVQAKVGKLGLDDWRGALLQLLETPYYSISLDGYDQKLPRRLLLVVAGTTTEHARDGISEWNEKHEHKVEIWDIYKIISQFEDNYVFAAQLLDKTTAVGSPQTVPTPGFISEAAGESELEPGARIGESVDEEKPTPTDIVGEKEQNISGD